MANTQRVLKCDLHHGTHRPHMLPPAETTKPLWNFNVVSDHLCLACYSACTSQAHKETCSRKIRSCMSKALVGRHYWHRFLIISDVMFDSECRRSREPILSTVTFPFGPSPTTSNSPCSFSHLQECCWEWKVILWVFTIHCYGSPELFWETSSKWLMLEASKTCCFLCSLYKFNNCKNMVWSRWAFKNFNGLSSKWKRVLGPEKSCLSDIKVSNGGGHFMGCRRRVCAGCILSTTIPKSVIRKLCNS